MFSYCVLVYLFCVNESKNTCRQNQKIKLLKRPQIEAITTRLRLMKRQVSNESQISIQLVGVLVY